jgi:hypothetical protein
MTKPRVAFVSFANVPKNKVEVALQIREAAFSTAQKSKVNLAPEYPPAVSEYLSQKHPADLEFVTCSIAVSVNPKVLMASFIAFSVRSTVKEPLQKSSA